MRSQAVAQHPRRILCVFPRYTPSFGTFEHAYKLMGVKAFMPPQGILLIAAYLPETWDVRFIDENIRAATDRELDWADAVFVSGMHIQRQAMLDIARRAHARGKVCALGGPSVSASPELYGAFDYLHIGEVGDATDALIATLDRDVSRPAAQHRFETAERLPLPDFPIPAYHLIDGGKYMLGSVQFSSGCPYRCEFCDIPALYGRQPRLKEPKQILAELDAMLARGPLGAIYFVDDNFIANRKAARELLPHLIAWQKERGYPVRFACEATLNIAKLPDLLEQMREAYFTTVFCGIETPELAALDAMSKEHNLAVPLLEGVETLNRHGMEVVSGIILGLDTDTPDTAAHINDFVDASHIPLLAINMLQALPRTPLWDRLKDAGRLIEDERRESNIVFLRPYEDVVESWHQCVRHAYEPEAVYARFDHNARHTFPNRKKLPVTRARLNWPNIKKALTCLFNIFLHVGILSDYRRTFWRMALPALRKKQIEEVIHIALVAHHLITYARECEQGRQMASNYAVLTGNCFAAGGHAIGGTIQFTTFYRGALIPGGKQIGEGVMADEFRGTAEPLTKAGFDTAVSALGAEAASLWSVVMVETSGFGFLPDRRPKILFERHIFHERTGGKFSAKHPDISNRDSGGYIGGAAEYERLSRAIGLDRVAALESVSWGLPQIMGFNAKACGYDGAEDMITRFQSSETAQLDGMVRFISHNKNLAKALKEKAWESFAKIYNGPGFAKNEYDKKLAKFHDQFATGPQPDIDIRANQIRLSYLGHNPNGIDGVLGKGTRRAISAFQTERRLPVTGELDAPTRDKLKEAAGV